MMDNSAASFDQEDAGVGVRVLGVVESTAPPLMRYQPDNPRGEQGRLYLQLERQFDRGNDQHDLRQPQLHHQTLNAMNTARDLLLKTISMGH